MGPARTWRFLLKGWLLSLLGFGLLGFLHIGQFAREAGLSWSQAGAIFGRDWLPWVVVTPLIFLLSFRLPVERESWKFALPVHLVFGLLMVMLCNGASIALDPPRPRGERNFEGWPPRRPPGAAAEPPSRGGRPERGRRGASFFLLTGRLGIPVYLALVSLAHALHFSRRARERERRELELTASLAQSRLEALRMQLQPHFLFNSLNAIAELLHSHPAGAEKMLVALSDLLRLTLETSGEQELSLSRELDFVKKYLAIERVRFGDRLRVEVDVSSDALDACVPAFLLQPLVENAIRHGLEPRPGPGRLFIEAQRKGRNLHVCVRDDGIGLRGGAPAGQGIGLSNTRARLRELYGEAAGLEVTGETGVAVEIHLPFRTCA